MVSYTKNMTTGKPAGLIFRFALPLMFGNIFQQLYTLVDTMVVGRALGVDALAAVGAAEWTNWMMLGIIQGVTQGFAIKMAQEFGAGHEEDLKRTIADSTLLAGVLSVILLAAGQIFVHPLMALLGTPNDIMGGALLYLRVIFLGIPVVMLYNMLACILRSMGDARTPLYAMGVASAVNIVLDLIFVLVLGFGIAAAAVATLIAQVVSSLYCLYRIKKMGGQVFLLTKKDFSLWGHSARRGKLLLLGLPMAFQNAVIAVGGMIVQSVVNDFGVIFIAGFTATNKLYGLLEVAATSYGYTMVTYVGQNTGAGEYGRVKSGMRAALLVALATSVLIGAAMLGFGKEILSLFISRENMEEFVQTLRVAYRYLAVMSVFLPILYVLHVVRSAVQGMGNTLLPMLSGVAEFLMRTLSALFLPLLVGENGIFFAEVTAWVGADLVLVASYIYVVRKWNKKEITKRKEQELSAE
ncbi:MAG: MATE family efflux transporter [Lachnospiraceae bacterium]|nr:MATE family efflux transporter [Lachnospiraceae bacterium]